jgi:hypothetical protein
MAIPSPKNFGSRYGPPRISQHWRDSVPLSQNASEIPSSRDADPHTRTAAGPRNASRRAQTIQRGDDGGPRLDFMEMRPTPSSPAMEK